MKIKPILAAVAVAVAALAQPALAAGFTQNEKGEVTHYNGISLPPIQTIEEAKELVEKDPAVNSGMLAADFYNWYGSAALPVYLNTAKKITKENP